MIYNIREVDVMSLEFSVWSTFYHDLSPEEMLERFKKNGVNHIELSTNHGEMLLNRDEDIKKTGSEYGDFAKSIGVKIPQGHLWLGCRLVSNPDAVNILKRWIDLYEAIGIENMVLHLDVYNMEDKTIEWMHDANAEKLCEIAEYIENKKFYICIENLFRRGSDSIEQLLSILERVNSKRFGITLDTGHLNIVKTTSQREFILKAGDKLRAVHINDNEGKADQHLIPFGKGNTDFYEVVSTLKETGFNGIFNYELTGEVSCPLEIRDLKLAYIKKCYNYLMK